MVRFEAVNLCLIGKVRSTEVGPNSRFVGDAPGSLRVTLCCRQKLFLNIVQLPGGFLAALLGVPSRGTYIRLV